MIAILTEIDLVWLQLFAGIVIYLFIMSLALLVFRSVAKKDRKDAESLKRAKEASRLLYTKPPSSVRD